MLEEVHPFEGLCGPDPADTIHKDGMRRVFIIIGIWFGLAALSTMAFGGGPKIVKGGEMPNDVVAGQPYVVNLMVTRYGRKLRHEKAVVTLSYAGGSVQYRATDAGHDGIYHVRVRVPLPGTWNYDVKVDGKLTRRGTLAVKLVSPSG
jgi:hypothetical protein